MIILEQTRKRRGRPRSNFPKKDAKSYSVDEILKGPSYPLELVTTKVGGMKSAFQDYCFEFHFNRNGNKFWRCLQHSNGCTAKIMSKGSSVYAIDSKHNHDSDPVVFVNTTELVSTKPQPGPSNTEHETNIAATIKQPAGLKLGADLKEKMKQRFAMLNRKLHKQ